MRAQLSRIAVCAIFILLGGSVFGQNELQQATSSNALVPFPPASVSIQTVNNQSTCSFISNAEIAEWKAERLEERIVVTYPEVQSVSIDWQTQQVTLVIPSAQLDETLRKIVRHFKYISYVQA